ncbi:hypothetical protein BDN67DRAFT_978184 [Paxillus ammoniavirescens]|nr:hypothetical protein BDN67DRAFT_978184 [Paxillus ammoniavirescens]
MANMGVVAVTSQINVLDFRRLLVQIRRFRALSGGQSLGSGRNGGFISLFLSLFFFWLLSFYLCIQPLGLGQVVYFSRITSFDTSMDSGRLPAYRSSYLLRFHPYPRVKPSAREMIMAASQENKAQPAPTQTTIARNAMPPSI